METIEAGLGSGSDGPADGGPGPGPEGGPRISSWTPFRPWVTLWGLTALGRRRVSSSLASRFGECDGLRCLFSGGALKLHSRCAFLQCVHASPRTVI